MKQKTKHSILLGLLILCCSCRTEGDYYLQEEGSVVVRAAFVHIADSAMRCRVDFGDVALIDSLPSQISNPVFIKESQLTSMLRIYRLENGQETLESETKYTFKPIPARADEFGGGATVSLLQLAAGAPVQVVRYTAPENPTQSDSTTIALQFFYADDNQPESVNITILAVERNAMNNNKDLYYGIPLYFNLANVPDTLKKEVATFTLAKGELSEPVLLDMNLYKEVNKGSSPYYLYKVTNAQGTVLQDYMPSSKVTTITAQISAGTTSRPVYQYAVMQLGYTSASVPFKSPTILVYGDKW